jgi:hypothetical protein
MLRLKSVLVFMCITCTLASCAQGKYGIKKIHAFSMRHAPGTIRVELPGETERSWMDTIYTLYLETNGKTASWETAWLNGQSFSVETELIKENLIEAGSEMDSGKKIIISARPGNQLFRLYFTRNDQKKNQLAAVKKGQILLRGKFGNKSVQQIVKSIKELMPIPSV